MRKDGCRTGISLALSLVISAVCGFAVYRAAGFVYAIGDDVIMRDIVSGAFTGRPDGHLIFIKYALGYVLSRLYLLNNQADWYGFFMAGTLFLALAAVLYRGLSEKKGIIWRGIYTGLALCLFIAVMVFHAAQFEWTISAAMLGSSGLYLYASGKGAGKGQRILEEVFAWLLLFLTFCIRTDVFFMVLPGFGISFLWKFVRGRKGARKFCFRELVLPAAVFVTAGAVMLTEAAAYRGEEWEEFQKFQAARTQVYDYSGIPSYEADPAFFEELGLSGHEIRNLRHYALYLIEGMDREMMEALSGESQRQNALQTGFPGRIKEGIRLAFGQFVHKDYFPASLPALLFLAGILILCFLYERRALLPLLLFWLAEGALWLALGYVGRLPERVAFSLHLMSLLCMAAYFYRLYLEEERGIPQKVKAVTVSGIFILVLAGAVFQWKTAAESNRAKIARDGNYQLFKDACREEPGKLYFVETFMAEPIGGAVVTGSGNFGQNNCITLGDWYSTSPLDRERFERLGIEDVEETILSNPDAFLVVRDVEDPGFLGSYFSYKYPEYSLVLRDVKVIEDRYYYLYQIQR